MTTESISTCGGVGRMKNLLMPSPAVGRNGYDCPIYAVVASGVWEQSTQATSA